MDQWTYWIHLPGVLLNDDEEQVWANGHLCRLSHDAWHELDQTVWQPADFRSSRPVFYRAQLQGKSDGRWGPEPKVFDTIVQNRSRIHRALCLVCPWPLPPDPQLSCSYVKAEREERCQVFMVGPAGRDWILTGHFRAPRIALDADVLESADMHYRQLGQLQAALPDSFLDSALQTLVMASLPDVYVGDGGPPHWQLVFLSAVSVLERLLVAEKKAGEAPGESITAAFSRQAAVLMSDDFDAVDELSERIKPVYRLRSDLLHGRRGFDVQDARTDTAMVMGLVLLQLLSRRLLALALHAGSAQDLVAHVAQAASSREHFQALQQALRAGSRA